MSVSAGDAKPHALLRPAIALSFIVVALIWGSTWYVIVDQIDGVPPSWSIAWRFLVATPCMAILALVMGQSLRIGRAGHMLAVMVGITQFCGNFNFVYRAEAHLTSGIVAVMFSLMIVTNAVFARLLLGERVTPRFYLGGAVALSGVALLLVHEARELRLDGSVPLGIAFAVGGILSASIANVLQANKAGQAFGLASLLAWSMFYGTICNLVLAFASAPDFVLPSDAPYWLGTLFLALAGSVVTFPLYYGLIRKIGAGRAAYQNILVIVVAMLISTFLEGYRWSPLAISGALLALVGMALALRAKTGPSGQRASPEMMAPSPSRKVG